MPQNLAGAALAQQGGHAPAEHFRDAGFAFALGAHGLPAVGRSHQCAQPHFAAGDFGVGAKRNRAAAAERQIHLALGAHASAGVGIRQGPEQI